ncbi:hypothetical protein [Roseomonas indoligenes]|uniref:Uncharacterized protein n=1 Tax=Roseomonas indoligenes TaxID=2820811 RepID=A0A940S6X6_9PROT|nr:hypothetical protein [Pararoseomonas indoligenes]MBP0496016.1 hypothetical protein [Pararoseomonas indoligenes]
MSRKIDSKALCLSLLAAESEAEIQAIIEGDLLLRDPSHWKPLDGRETNFNVMSNQASDGGKALTELMTNMVDAVLMRHAYEKGIDPKGPAAPKTMYEAIDRLIKPLRGGKLVNLDPRDPWLRDFAQKNLVIGVTGAKSKKEGLPCYTFADNGEGQQPQDFERTFLSLKEGNKASIQFVQGKYNMGSSGVLSYCGTRWFKLIVSRRHDRKGPWGWTLMRRRPSTGDRMPVAEYFVMPDGRVSSFEADELYPFQRADRKRYDRMHLASGTIIKLYDYQVGAKFSGFKGSREALNENLVETMLPFRLLDLRQKPDKSRGSDRAEGVDPRSFYGMEYLLLRSHREDEHDEEEDAVAGSERKDVAMIEDPGLGRITISAIPLKRDLPGWLKPASTNNRVFHAVNGQVQFKQTRGYLSQSCGLSALKDRVVIIVDASELSFAAHNDVWKGDREHIRNTIVGEHYKEKVTEAIRGSSVLKEMQQQIAREELDHAAKTERNELFQKLVDADRTLADLLNDRDPVIFVPSAGGTRGKEAGNGTFEGKYSPTFLRVEEKLRDRGLEVPLNRARPVAARTDAENGYLLRAENRGTLTVNEEVRSRFTMRTQLHDGRLTVFLEPLPGKVSAGEILECRLVLQDPAMPEALEVLLSVRITDDEKPDPKPKLKASSAKAGDGNVGPDGLGKPAPTHGLPAYHLLTQDGRTIGDQETLPWPEGFDGNDGGVTEDLGEGRVIYKVNYDNAYHLKYRAGQRGDVAKDVVTEKYILGMRILMMSYERALRTNGEQGANGEGIAEYRDVFRRLAARGAAATVLALAENLPKIVNSAAVVQDAE